MHSHNHAEKPGGGHNQKVLVAALCITAFFCLVEFIGGLLSNSLALLSDAGHMLTDTLALILALFALFIARKPADQMRTYGYHRTEILAALINGSVLIFIAFFILYRAYLRMFSPPEVKSGLMLIIATIGLLANVGGAFVLRGSSRDNINVRSAFLHMIGDLISSVGVIIGAIIIRFTGWTIVDPIVAALVGIIILKSAFRLVLESGHILLEGIPDGVDFNSIYRQVKEIKGVNDLHDLHIWTLGPGKLALSAHLLIDDQTVSNAGEIMTEVNHLLAEKFNITHTTIQPECRKCVDGSVCNLIAPHQNFSSEK